MTDKILQMFFDIDRVRSSQRRMSWSLRISWISVMSDQILNIPELENEGIVFAKQGFNIFGSSCRTLNCVRAYAAAGSREKLREHSFSSAWLTHQHKSAVSSEGDYTALNKCVIAIEFALYLHFAIGSFDDSA